jgi:hypothetical protein
MKKILLILSMLVMCAIAQAGFTTVVCSNPTFDANHQWGFVIGEQKVWLQETYVVVGTDSVFVDGTTNTDPDLWMTKAVKNQNGHAWTGYSLTLGGNATFVFPLSTSSDLLPIVAFISNQIFFIGGTVAV